ncbi:hypothetical protein FRAHR75_250022 [Frankia sp. Hr75.2]|nr:hypothetical protein FRAHR75_250022 [Frankia sp. Hr75.2]SQD97175.1 hypothetical protein FMEAI12_3950005 [Parafrankia sp. Ea1.12]
MDDRRAAPRRHRHRDRRATPRTRRGWPTQLQPPLPPRRPSRQRRPGALLGGAQTGRRHPRRPRPDRPRLPQRGGLLHQVRPQAEAALRNLVGLHGPFWNKPGLTNGADWLRQTDEAGLSFLGEILTAATEPFLDRFQDRLSPPTQTHCTAPPITSPAGADTSAPATPSSTATTASTTSCSPNPTR